MKKPIPTRPNVMKSVSGFALLPIILAIIISGLFLSVGISVIDSKANHHKYEVSGDKIEKAVNAIISWTKETGRLPDNTEFLSVTGISEDAWKNDFVYVYDGNLAGISSGGICGRQSTVISSAALSDIAFIIISGGNDYTIDSTPKTSGPYAGNASLSNNDVIKTITLNRLRSNICLNQNQVNQLSILNKELPYICEGESYTATLFAQGGVSPYSWSYDAKPPWLNLSQTGANYQCQGTPSANGYFTTEIVLRDSVGNTVETQFEIAVYECEDEEAEDPEDPEKSQKPKKPKKPKKNKKTKD